MPRSFGVLFKNAIFFSQNAQGRSSHSHAQIFGAFSLKKKIVIVAHFPGGRGSTPAKNIGELLWDLSCYIHPILDMSISILCPSFVRSSSSRYPPLDSEMGWTGEVWSKSNLLKWHLFFSRKRKHFKTKFIYNKKIKKIIFLEKKNSDSKKVFSKKVFAKNLFCQKKLCCQESCLPQIYCRQKKICAGTFVAKKFSVFFMGHFSYF